jgi:hypothetical protein
MYRNDDIFNYLQLKTKKAVKKLLEIGAYIFIGAVLLNIIETIYFGCNKVAETRAEEIWDVICLLLVNIGAACMAVGFLLMNKKDYE